MGISYKEATSSATASPQGHFPDPHPAQDDFEVSWFTGSASPEYWVCVVKVINIAGNTLEISVFAKNGQPAPARIKVDLDDLDQVWRHAPSTVKPAPGQPPLSAGECIILCISDAKVAEAGLDGESEKFAKHPFAGGETIRRAFREIRKNFAGLDNLPSIQLLRSTRPELF
jgi:hypothetical protein